MGVLFSGLTTHAMLKVQLPCTPDYALNDKSIRFPVVTTKKKVSRQCQIYLRHKISQLETQWKDPQVALTQSYCLF